MTVEEYRKAKADITEYESQQRQDMKERAEKLTAFLNDLFPQYSFVRESACFISSAQYAGGKALCTLSIEFYMK